MALRKAMTVNFYTANQTRALDRIAIEKFDIPGYTLMRRAGEYAFDVAIQLWPQANSFVVVCGTGNNGGDGYVFASCARKFGYSCRVLQLGETGNQSGAALSARLDMEKAGVRCEAFDENVLHQADLIVDAIFGTGLRRAIEGVWKDAILAINASSKPVLAMDIPSGLNADTGAVQGISVQADATVGFIARKQGLYTAAGPEYCGQHYFYDLDVPPEIYAAVEAEVKALAPDAIVQQLARRPRDAHKGDFGHCLLAGGNHAMSGAIRLAGEAALRTGSGLVSIATRDIHALPVTQARPELMCHGVDHRQGLESALRRATVVGIGPGLGQDEWAKHLFDYVISLTLPAVVDADALNLLAQSPIKKDNWILTPHPGEAARLLGRTIESVQADRFAAVRDLQQKYGGVCVLKGAGTLIYDGQKIYICLQGNPGMATAGSGDVLTGILTSVLAQSNSLKLDLSEVAQVGVFLHATAGDEAAMSGETGMIASDIIDQIRSVILNA